MSRKFCTQGGFVSKKKQNCQFVENQQFYSKSPIQSGARGSRTLVQTGKPYAFYTLSHRLGFRAQARPRPPTCALSSKVSPLHRGLQWLVPICLHHRVGLLRNNSVRVMSRPRTWCRDKANLLYFD